MRAASITEVGGLPVLGEAPDPVRGDGEALIRIEAVPLNPIEINVGAGRFYGGAPPLPYIPGGEGVGRVVEAEALEPGTLVWAHGAGMGTRRDGTLAELISVPKNVLVPLADGVAPALAGALGVAGLAGWLPVAYRAPVEEGDSVLVLGATGTVGLVALQGARLLGAARVVAAGRRPEALERARRLGADATVSLDEEDLVAAFRGAFGGEGPSYVIDPLWGEPAVAAATVALPGARLVNIGQSAGIAAPFLSADVRGKQLNILGFSNFATPPEALRREYLRLVGLAQEGKIEVDIETFPFDRAAEAWQRQAEGAGAKVVITL